MKDARDRTGFLLDRWYRLPDGPQVRLRLARSSDALAIREPV